MGRFSPNFKKALFDEIIDNIQSNTSHYYAFAAHTTPYTSSAPAVTEDDYTTSFINDWTMIFGKKLYSYDIIPVVQKNIWASNTVYHRYDNTSNTLFTNNIFYAVSEPTVVGGNYNIYKCIDNANGSPSTIDPGTIGTPTQVTTFTTSDNYKWRYICSVSTSNYNKFATDDYIPVYTNPNISSTANLYAGVEVVMIANGGSGYENYHNGTVRGVVNTTYIQIDTNASNIPQYYNNNSIYFYNTLSATAQIKKIVNYVVVGGNHFVQLETAANTDNISADVTHYKISPTVVFNTDGNKPSAYSVVNSVSNSISNVVILDIGSDVSRADVSIESGLYGSGANMYAIVPPPGGHGFNPVSELNSKGIGIAFNFSNTESNTILTSTLYNKIGLIKNPYILEANTSKGNRYYANTFSQILKAQTSPMYTFTVGQTLTGQTSEAKGIVVFANATHFYMTGDKHFIDGEGIANSSGSYTTDIIIDEIGDVYTKDIVPIYVQNINNVNRSNTQTEAFKLVIEI